jgi:hypothetical protein
MNRELPSEAEIETAWQKAKPAPGRDPRLYRIAPDVIQSLIRRDRYAIRGEHGWRIEHGKPVSFGDSSVEQAIRLVQQEIQPTKARSLTKSNSSS